MGSVRSGGSVRFGLIGLDSPHGPSFTRLFNGDGQSRAAVQGGRVVAAWPGEASPDLALSRDRLGEFTDSVRALGVPIEASLVDVARRCDVLLVLAVDARRHADLFRQCVPYGKPVYVDTRFALSVAEARAMLSDAERHGAMPLAGSPKRFSADFLGAAAGNRADGVDVAGPMPMQPTQPGLFWYGIHMVDLVVAAMGIGCVEVLVRNSGQDELIVATWEDGRTATIRGSREWRPVTQGSVHRGATSTGFTITATEAMFAGLLRAIVDASRTGVPPIRPDEIEHVVAIAAAANRSRDERCAVRVGAAGR